MALMNCPECDREISDQAHSCPHCGYPINDAATGNQNNSGCCGCLLALFILGMVLALI